MSGEQGFLPILLYTTFALNSYWRFLSRGISLESWRFWFFQRLWCQEPLNFGILSNLRPLLNRLFLSRGLRFHPVLSPLPAATTQGPSHGTSVYACPHCAQCKVLGQKLAPDQAYIPLAQP